MKRKAEASEAPSKMGANEPVNILTPRRKLKFDEDLASAPEFKANREIHTLGDLIKVIQQWKKTRNDYVTKQVSFTEIEYDNLILILPHLKKLNKMVGMMELKRSIVKQMLYFVQKFNGNEMMNIVLVGNPGTGKTTVAELLGKIYSELSIVSGPFKKVGRAELVGKYCGHTAIKTQNLLNSCKGGVIFIDEAYSLGSDQDDRDTFARECVTTLTKFLSENPDTICILAGYEHELRTKLFAHNTGLERRFPWWFKMDEYTSNELKDIFKYLIKQAKWKLKCDDEVLSSYFKHKEHFSNHGGDCQFFLNQCKIEHANRIFGCSNEEKTKVRFKLSAIDLKYGYRAFLESKKKHIPQNEYKSMMYI